MSTKPIIPAPLIYDHSENLFTELDYKGKVLIIGAGAAGLFAGFMLKSEGIDFTILEASGQIGGRLGKLAGFADYPLDLGAEWLHGKKSMVGALIKKTKTKITKDKSEEFYWFKNQLKKKVPRKFVKEWEADENLTDLSFRDYADQKGFGEEYRYIVEQIAGDYGADSSEISVKWTAKEEEAFSSGFKDYKFEETYFDLIDRHLIDQLRDSISLHTVVSKINYSQEKIKITDQQGNDYIADKVIITVPITILQDGDIEFTPPLPAQKTEAFQKIGMSAGMKVFMKFSQRFYHENILGGKICAAYADETIGKQGKDHVLMAFVMGKQAEYLNSLASDQLITETLLQELDEMYQSQASDHFLESFIIDWTNHPFIRGAYSFSKVGIGKSRNIAAESIDDKLFFAGEAMNLNGHHQTLHGAMETGYREVRNIRASLGK